MESRHPDVIGPKHPDSDGLEDRACLLRRRHIGGTGGEERHDSFRRSDAQSSIQPNRSRSSARNSSGKARADSSRNSRN